MPQWAKRVKFVQNKFLVYLINASKLKFLISSKKKWIVYSAALYALKKCWKLLWTLLIFQNSLPFLLPLFPPPGHSLTPGKLPTVTQVVHFIVACKMMSHPCYFVWVATTRNPRVYYFQLPMEKVCVNWTFYFSLAQCDMWMFVLKNLMECFNLNNYHR